MRLQDLFEHRDACYVCGQTPCNCTHVMESLNEFAPGNGDDREPDEEEILRQLASRWWLGTEQQMAQAQKTLDAMGWEIGPVESGDDDAGVFLIRPGDENGDTYIAFNHSDLSLDEAEGLNEFAPDDGGESRKFIPWPEFIEQLKQILHKDFDCKENIVKSTIKARFVPHDPMEYGPTMLYSYYETRRGRDGGAISTRGSIQVGKYTKGGLFGQPKDQLLTGFSLLKGHPFERHFDLTFNNIYKIANIIQGNTQGALEFQPQQQGVAEGRSK